MSAFVFLNYESFPTYSHLKDSVKPFSAQGSMIFGVSPLHQNKTTVQLSLQYKFNYSNNKVYYDLHSLSLTFSFANQCLPLFSFGFPVDL